MSWGREERVQMTRGRKEFPITNDSEVLVLPNNTLPTTSSIFFFFWHLINGDFNSLHIQTDPRGI